MDIRLLIDGLHPLERKVVPFLYGAKKVSELVTKSGMQEVEVVRALQWLENKNVVVLKKEEETFIVLDENGKKYLKEGLPEHTFLSQLLTSDKSMKEVMQKVGADEFNACVGILKKSEAIEMKNGQISITKKGREFPGIQSTKELLAAIAKGGIKLPKAGSKEEFEIKKLSERKNVVKKITIKDMDIELTELGKKLSREKISQEVMIEALTPEIMKSRSWKGKKFRGYDISAPVPKISSAKRHFMNQAIEYVKSIWLEMGFEEMTGTYVDTSHWDLDSLFVPQDHPARTMQDTFYVADESGKKPLLGKLPKDFKKIKDVHEDGGNTGSKGWQMDWDEIIAKEVIMRTHATVLSAHKLSTLKKEDLPKKFFSIGKVFRNETMDWKHLFEFEQIEGIVVSEEVTFRHLLGYLRQFFGKMGFTDVRLRPAHFPYTEPSVEVDVYNPVKKEWVELGGAGILRPEVTKTLMGTEVPVLAWGLGLARIAVEYWSIKDIRETYKNDLSYLENTKVLLK